MIQPQELRLGNILEQGVVTRLQEMSARIMSADGKYAFVHYEDLEPIPLTEEWLIKLGFHEVLGVYAGYGREINLKLVDGYWDAYFKGKYVSVIKHVHQLQNLFYSITGHELTLK